MDIKVLNDITGQILRYEDKVKFTKRRIEKMEVVGAHNGFKAQLELTTFGCSGYKDVSTFSLTKEEVVEVLKRTLADHERILETYKMVINSMR